MSPVPSQPDLRQIGTAALADVLEAFLALPIGPLETPGDSALPGAVEQLTGTVLLAGPQLSASVRLYLPVSLVDQAVRRLTGQAGSAPAAEGLLEDAAGELANQVAGRVAARLAAAGYPAALVGAPAIRRGSGAPDPAQPDEHSQQIGLLCAGQRLSLVLQCRYGAP